MLADMLRLACAVLAAATAVMAWAAPQGKVVRVERDRGMKAVPRLCDIQPMAKEGLCVGQPTVGDRVALIDQDRGMAVGEFRIDSAVGAADPFVCAGTTPVVFKIKGTVTSGDPDVIADSGRTIGLRNLALDPKVARVVKDQTVPGTQERAELALDVDGNGRLVFDGLVVVVGEPLLEALHPARHVAHQVGNLVPTEEQHHHEDDDQPVPDAE